MDKDVIFSPVKERHGVNASGGGFVSANEIAGAIRIITSDGSATRYCDITADEAAYLASELYRMALRLKEKHP